LPRRSTTTPAIQESRQDTLESHRIETGKGDEPHAAHIGVQVERRQERIQGPDDGEWRRGHGSRKERRQDKAQTGRDGVLRTKLGVDIGNVGLHRLGPVHGQTATRGPRCDTTDGLAHVPETQRRQKPLPWQLHCGHFQCNPDIDHDIRQQSPPFHVTRKLRGRRRRKQQGGGHAGRVAHEEILRRRERRGRRRADADALQDALRRQDGAQARAHVLHPRPGGVAEIITGIVVTAVVFAVVERKANGQKGGTEARDGAAAKGGRPAPSVVVAVLSLLLRICCIASSSSSSSVLAQIKVTRVTSIRFGRHHHHGRSGGVVVVVGFLC